MGTFFLNEVIRRDVDYNWITSSRAQPFISFYTQGCFSANHELPYDHYKYLDARRYSFYIVGEQIMYLDVEVSYNPNYAGLVLNFKQASSDIL